MLSHPVVRTWFERRFPQGPTPAQLHGWRAISAGEDTLIAAPTGSGKTLAAFLVCIDRRLAAADQADPAAGIEVVYVSPLKALAVDIHHNLEQPLREMRELAASGGQTLPELRVALRTSDTPASKRMELWKRPPQILVTTPESLYLLLTAERGRQVLATARTIIVDEIHALARDKRGAHLALTMERLSQLCGGARLQRIGLSATQRPIEHVAALLVGVDQTQATSPEVRPCTLVDQGHRRELDLALELPDSPLCAVASKEQLGEVLDRIALLAQARRTTLVFVNTRRLAERLAHQLGERLGVDQVAAHHGSLSKDRRQTVEARLRSGELRLVVATASLELGIDIGPVELVCQIGSPRNIATFLQRVGRSGHARFATPVGRLYPLTRDELLECAALLQAVRRGELDAIVVPTAPMDVLAQQIVAECAAQTWDEAALFEALRCAYPYRELSREAYDEVLELMSDGVMTGRGRRGAYLQRDRLGAKLHARRGARLASLTSGGAIPESADYRVVAEPDETFVGTVNEDFAIESMAGDVFLLGSTAWRIVRVHAGMVRVVSAQGATPSVPFWLGEAPGRSAELSEQVGALRSCIDRELQHSPAERVAEYVARETGIGMTAAQELVAYLGAARQALGMLPTQHDLVFERFFDDTGGMQLVLHAPFGSRVNRALGLLLRKRFCTSFDFELQAAATDDAIVLSLGPQHSFPLDDMLAYLRPARLREALVQALILTPMFAVRWRWNLGRALLVLRMRGGKKNPAPLQRMEADDLMVAVFPSLAACQDNAQGPREVPDHLLVRQTLHDCLHEAMDVNALEQLLLRIQSGQTRLHFRDTTEPSVLTHEILNARPYAFLDDAPLEERRTRAVSLRRGLPPEARALAVLDADAVARVRAEAAREPRSSVELYDALMECGVLLEAPAWVALFGVLASERRAAAFELKGAVLWVAHERAEEILPLFPEARWIAAPSSELRTSSGMTKPRCRQDVIDSILEGHLECLGPCTVQQLHARTRIPTDDIEAALARLERIGFVLRGHFESDAVAEQVCARRLLARIHVYTQKRLRREIEPVTAQDFMRFLLRHHGVEPQHQRMGLGGVLHAIEQLQGYEVAAALWESDVLSARVHGYRSEWLDGLCLSGQVCWGRLSLPSLMTAVGSSVQPTRATPITLAIRNDLPWLLAAARVATEEQATSAPQGPVVSQLTAAGALFFSQLVAQTGLSESAVRDALWEGVARGLLSADGFEALRNLLAPSLARATVLPLSARRTLRSGARGLPQGEGRWSLLRATLPADDYDALCEAVAEQWVSRWGVLFRELALCERSALPWRDVVHALRRLEARGVLRGGHFVSGFTAEQYASPEAIAALRAIRREPRRGTRVDLSACDPLNLTGVLFSGPRVPALRTHRVVYHDGVPSGAEAAAPRSSGRGEAG